MSSKTKKREALIHFEFYRLLQNVLEKKLGFKNISFSRVEPEYSEKIKGRADLVILDHQERIWLVIEAKRLDKGKVTRKIDPFSPIVIEQAYDYANKLGAPYFATFNGEYFVLFRTFEQFTPLIDRQAKAYYIKDLKKFSSEILDEIDALEAESLQWDTKESLIINRLKSVHSYIIPKIIIDILETLNSDESNVFQKDFKIWAESLGLDVTKNDDIKEGVLLLAEQASYLLINRLFFLKILQDHPSYSYKAPHYDLNNLIPSIKKAFKKVIKEINFEAVYDLDKVFDTINYNFSEELIKEFIQDLEGWKLKTINDDIIGHIYQKVIPPKERHDLGQYYTPADIIKIICDYCIQSENDFILDPACGSGGFLIGAYDTLAKLKKKRTKIHPDNISQIFGIDINRFPAHLSAINLALRDLSEKTNYLNISVIDFFNLHNKQTQWATEKVSPSGSDKEYEKWEQIFKNQFDVIISNPPYIRQELISDKNLVRNHLSKHNEEEISKRSDIYIYFITYATQFLKIPKKIEKEKGDTKKERVFSSGGRLGFLISERWLYNEYGEGIQEFFLDNYCINAIISFDQQVFEEALIETGIIFLTRETNELKRNNNYVKFLRIKESIEIKDVLEILRRKQEQEEIIDVRSYLLNIKKQESLINEDKWRRFLHAPKIYWTLLENADLVVLDSLCDLFYGIKTGINKFFYLKDDEIAKLELLPELYSKLVKSVGQLDYISFRSEDTKLNILNLEPLLVESKKRLRKKGIPSDLKEDIFNLLKEKGLDKLLKWIKKGEREEFHKIRSVQGREIWFSVGALKIPTLIYTKEMWKKNLIFFNEGKSAVDQHLYGIYPYEDIDPYVLLGILNSDVTAIFRDLHGRIASGQALSRIENTLKEARDLLVLNPRVLNENGKKKIKEALKNLIKRERSLIEPSNKGAFYNLNPDYVALRRNLNKAVLDAFNFSQYVDDVESGFKYLLDIRMKMGGLQTKVLIKEKLKKFKKELTGAIEINGRVNKKQKNISLDKFLKKSEK